MQPVTTMADYWSQRDADSLLAYSCGHHNVSFSEMLAILKITAQNYCLELCMFGDLFAFIDTQDHV